MYHEATRQVEAAFVGMADKGFLVDAVAQFVQGNVWRDAVTHFLESHYKRFLVGMEPQGKVTEHSIEQFDSFMAFKDRVERMLEKVVGDLGCSGEDLVAAIQENLTYESALSTEKRFCIQTLLTFDDYDAFYSRISEYAAEKQVAGFDATASGDMEISEWQVQEAIARSILEAHARGQLDDSEASWLPWAQAFVQMSQCDQAETAAGTEDYPAEAMEASEAKAETKDIGEDEQDEKEDSRMHELEKILIRERLKVDLLVAQRIADANTQMKKQMLNLAAEAVQNEQVEDLTTSAEEEMAGLFTQIETIQERLKDVKSRCFKFERVTQHQMDTVYLFLKEKVHYKQDLVSQEKYISGFIFTQIHEKDEALIPLMLEWLLLESEQLRTQNQIQEHLAGPPDEGYWTQAWDDASQAFYYSNSVSKESVWEPPAAGFYDINQEFQVPGLEAPSATDAWSTRDNASAAQNAESKAWGESWTQETSELYNSGSQAEVETPTLDQASSQLDATFELKIGPDATEMLEMESVLERISREHDQERKRLELVFELEKARQKEDLRKRKEKKRLEKLAKKQRQKDESFRGEDLKEDGEATARPLPASVASQKVEGKHEDKSHVSINVPGRGRIDLSHLLSDTHATRHREMKGLTSAHERAMLNPATLRYLTEQMAIKQPEVLGQQVRKEILLEEHADEK